MNMAVVRTWLVYVFTLMLVCLLNIDGVLSWYAGKSEGREEILRGLAELKRIQMVTGIQPVLNRMECAAGFAFEGSYKDKSKCREYFRDDQPGPPKVAGMHTSVPEVSSLDNTRMDSAVQREEPFSPHPEINEFDQTAGDGQSRVVIAQIGATKSKRRHARRRHRIRTARGLHPPKSEIQADEPSGSREPPFRGVAATDHGHEAPAEPVFDANGQAIDERSPSNTMRMTAARGAHWDIVPAMAVSPVNIQVAAVRELSESGPATGNAPDSVPEVGILGMAAFHSVLLVGDSLAHGLAMALGPDLKDQAGAAFSCFAKVSSGLNNPNVINWEKTVRMLLQQGVPNLVLVMMGVNDANNHIRDGSRVCLVGTPEWEQAYENKVENFLRIFSESRVRVYWIGVPVVREEWLQNRVLMANMAARNACGKMENCRFIDATEALCDENKKYTNYLKEPSGCSVRVRAKDGIHFSMAGGNLLSKYIMHKLKDGDSGSSIVGN